LWLDPAAEPIDLSDFFATRPTHSRAYGIDATGAIVGEADDHAVLWLPVVAAAIPVPSAALTGLALLGLLFAAHWAQRRVTRTA
jgi:hypothetical protein